MEDFLESLLNKHVLSGSSILSLIDDYTLFCHYMGYQPEINEVYTSPLRSNDTQESFCLFYGRNGRLFFSDYGTGDHGDVFKFVALLHDCSVKEAFRVINKDFSLGFEGVPKADTLPKKLTPFVKPKKELRVTTKPFSKKGLEYWRQYHIQPYVLDKYQVKEVDWLHFDKDAVKPRGLAFAYQIGKYYKIYQPYSVNYKFTSSYPREYVEGYLQLGYKSDTLIITKSLKDVMCLHVLGFEAVSPKSESTDIPEHLLRRLESKYKYIYLLFDNDSAGKRGSEKYPYPSLFLKKSKDISDHIKEHGIMDTRWELSKLLHDGRAKNKSNT